MKSLPPLKSKKRARGDEVQSPSIISLGQGEARTQVGDQTGEI